MGIVDISTLLVIRFYIVHSSAPGSVMMDEGIPETSEVGVTPVI